MCFRLQVRGQETPTQLKTETDPVSETLCSSVFLEYRTMDKVQKPNSPECHIPLSELFKVYFRISVYCSLITQCKLVIICTATSGKGEVMYSLHITDHQAMMKYRGVGGAAPHILNLNNRQKPVVSSTLHFMSKERPGTCWTGGWMGTRASLNVTEKRESQLQLRKQPWAA
jgi:hypothetical protein